MLVELPHVGILEKCFIVLVEDVRKIGRQLKNYMQSISTKNRLFAKGYEESNLVGVSKQKLAFWTVTTSGVYLPLTLTCGTNTTERL
jgi:FMN-dependent NADH-azoreductase